MSRRCRRPGPFPCRPRHGRPARHRGWSEACHDRRIEKKGLFVGYARVRKAYFWEEEA